MPIFEHGAGAGAGVGRLTDPAKPETLEERQLRRWKGAVSSGNIPDDAPDIEFSHGGTPSIRRLLWEIGRGKGDNAPQSWWVTDPEYRLLTSVKKSPEAAKTSSRLDTLYQNIARQVPPEEWGNLEPALRDGVIAYVENSDGFRDKIRSGYETTGVLGPGSGLGAASSWLQSFPGMVYAAGDMVGNATSSALGGRPDPHGDAAGRLAKSFATAVAPMRAWSKPVTDALYGHQEELLPSTHFEDGKKIAEAARAAKDALPWDSVGHTYKKPASSGLLGTPYASPTPAGREYWEKGLSQGLTASQPKSGEEYFVGHGVPRGLASVLGAGTDAIFNPFFGASEAVAASNLLPKISPMAKWAAGEFGLDASLLAHRALSPFFRDDERKREQLIDRLETASR